MKTLIPAFLITFLFSSIPLHAQTAANFCEGIKNTANMVVCLNKYYEEMKIELSGDFNSILNTLPAEDSDGFKETQKLWINYRDAECAWETGNETVQSLRRVKELYCLVRLTEQRQNVLRLAQSDLETQHAYQGITPRWENVLNDIYGDVYWKANSRMKADLDCNGRDENIILGMRSTANSADQTPSFVIGLVESPATGKPSARIFDVPVSAASEDENNPQLCAQNIEISVRQNLSLGEECERSEVEVKTKTCGNYVIRWQDESFNLIPEDTSPETIR
jgi:uncharacterized protein YecT (DUF1311 family)